MPESIRILCVDDELYILNALRRQLCDENYEVHTALTSEKGLEILQQIRPVHVVLSDYRMPHLNGIDFLRCASRYQPGAVGIILSGFADTPEVKQALDRHDFFAFLSKPWSSDDMRKTVAEAVAQSLARLGKAEQH